jgi:hypothetical protein
VLLLCVTTTPKHLSVNHLYYPITIVNLLCDITAGWQLGSPLLSFLFFFFSLFFSFLELVPYLRLWRHTSHFLIQSRTPATFGITLLPTPPPSENAFPQNKT